MQAAHSFLESGRFALENLIETTYMTNTNSSYLSLKLAKAKKTGQRASGEITYRVLCDTQKTQLALTITGNEGGGYWSREVIPLEGIELCLADFSDGKPLPAKALRDTFVGKSVNNSGFLAAILRAEGLLEAAPDVAHQHRVTGIWAQWKSQQLQLESEPYVPETGKQPVTIPAESVEQSSDKVNTIVRDGPHPSRRKGRGSKARTVVTPQQQETDDASAA